MQTLFSLFNFTDSKNASQCFYTMLLCFGNVKFKTGDGGGGAVQSPVKRGFHLRVEILRLRGNCQQGPFSRLDCEVPLSACSAR